jgi:RNA polymerase sigma-70 factor (ECF subfamily)
MHDDDRQMVEQLRNGDESAFRAFFANYFPRLYRFVLRRVGDDKETARDVVQAALGRAVHKLHLYRGEASLFTWLCQIARNELADERARSGRHGVVPSDLVAREEDPEVRAALESMPADSNLEPEGARQREELADLVHAALDYLPQRYAQVLELKYLEDLPVESVAERLGITGIAVQSLLARARAAFREACASLDHALEFSKGGEP